MEVFGAADIISRAINMSQKESLTAGIPYTFYPVNATGRNIQSAYGKDDMVQGCQHAVASGLPVAMAVKNSQYIIYYDPSVNIVRRYNTLTKTSDDVGVPYSGPTAVYFGLQPFQPAAGFEGGLRRRRRQTRRRSTHRRRRSNRN